MAALEFLTQLGERLIVLEQFQQRRVEHRTGRRSIAVVGYFGKTSRYLLFNAMFNMYHKLIVEPDPPTQISSFSDFLSLFVVFTVL